MKFVNFKVEWVEGCLDPVRNQNTPPLGHQYYTGVSRLGSQRSNFIRPKPNTYTIWVTLLDYILSLRRRVFSLWTFLCCGCDEEHTDFKVVRTHNPTGAGVAACSGAPWEGEQGRIVTMHKFVCLRDFSKNPHGSMQYPLFRAKVLAISPSW